MQTDSAPQARGMYGVRISGLEGCTCLEAVPHDWPEWHVSAEVVAAKGTPCSEFVDSNRGRICFGDGSTAEATRTDTGAVVHLRLSKKVDICQVPHPYLAIVGMFSALWGNGLPIHAGAVGVDGAAWLVLAGKSGGKSTSLALLEQAGYPILTDDLAVIDTDLNVHRGPAFIDLRPETAKAMGVGTNLGVLGARERWRHTISARPLTLPLGGIVVAEWGNNGMEPVGGSAKLQAVAGNLALSVPGPWNNLFMEIVTSTPVLRWSRPKDLTTANTGIEALLATIRRSS